MRKFFVYVHVCPNGKRYVGCTAQAKPEYRWKGGRGYENQLFGKAVKKYGWSSIKHEVWELTCESEMYYAEKYLIAYYHTTEKEFGYNLSSGGEKSTLGCKCSEETRRKISKANKGKHRKPFSEEARKHMAEASRRKAKDPEYRKKLSKARKGKPFSEEHRKHLAETNRRNANDPERVRKISETHRNKPKIKIKLPDGTIREMSKSLLSRHYIKRGKSFEYVS